MEAENVPCILTVGVDNSKIEKVVKLIINSSSIVEAKLLHNCAVYGWHIENKYYTADIQLHSPVSKDITSNHNCARFMEAIILYIDHLIIDLIQELNDWVFIANNCNLNVKILLLNCILPTSEKDFINRWCIENDFELIELELIQDNKTKACNNDDNNNGINRLIEVFHAHKWSNLKLKDRISFSKTIEKNQENNVLDSLSIYRTANSKDTNHSLEEEFDQLEELSTLFKNLESMKKEISTLSGSEKLNQAEKVVKAFWKAVGGDSDEFSNSEPEIE